MVHSVQITRRHWLIGWHQAGYTLAVAVAVLRQTAFLVPDVPAVMRA